jgi:hypothetical protein
MIKECYGRYAECPVGDANTFNGLLTSIGGSCRLYGNYTENRRLKRPILAFAGLCWFRHFLAYPITFWANRGEVAWLGMGETNIHTYAHEKNIVALVKPVHGLERS